MSQRLLCGRHLLQPRRLVSEAGQGRIDSVQASLMHAVQLTPLDFCDSSGRTDRYQRTECGDLRIPHWAAGKPFGSARHWEQAPMI